MSIGQVTAVGDPSKAQRRWRQTRDLWKDQNPLLRGPIEYLWTITSLEQDDDKASSKFERFLNFAFGQHRMSDVRVIKEKWVKCLRLSHKYFEDYKLNNLPIETLLDNYVKVAGSYDHAPEIKKLLDGNNRRECAMKLLRIGIRTPDDLLDQPLMRLSLHNVTIAELIFVMHAIENYFSDRKINIDWTPFPDDLDAYKPFGACIYNFEKC